MRVLQISSARSIGGGERHVADLTNALAARGGHEIFTALAPGSPLAEKLCVVLRENIFFVRMRNALDVSSIFELKKIIEQNNVEIVHAHLARDYPLAAFAARLSANKPRLILTRHVLFPLNRLHKFALKNASGVIAVSKAAAESLKHIFPPEKITTIYNGVDLKSFSPKERTPIKFFTIGTIGHLAPIKGHDVFVRAAQIVSASRADARFIVVGEDKSKTGENRRMLESLISNLNLSTNIELAGWTNDVHLFFEKFDLFVSSARAEPFGLVIVEAMASGVPVVATKTEGAREILEDGVSGVLVDIEDAESLAQAILNLSHNQTERLRLAANARRRVETAFSLEKMIAETEDFYRQTLANSAD